MKKIKLGDVLDIRRGASLSGKFYSNEGNLIRLTLGNFNYPRGGFQENFSKENIFFVGTVNPVFILKAGDIITPLTEQVSGLLGETATIPESDKYIQSGDIGLVIPDEIKIDKRFAYYLVSSPIVRKQLDSAAQQTKIRHTSPNAIKSCTTWIPEDISTQRRIAEFLDALDDKIALNKKINATLEAMAKTLYDYWFVQFDFSDEHGKPYKTSGGKMIYNSELGREIPVGWEVSSLSTITTVTQGNSPNGSTLNDTGEGMIFFQGKTDFGFRFPEVRIYTTAPCRLAEKFDTLLSVRAPVGDVNMAHEKCCIGRGLAAIHSNYPSFIYYTLKKLKLIFEKLGSIGTTFDSITKDDVMALKIYIPPTRLVEKFENVVSKFDTEIFSNTDESYRLAKLSDWLLPMLMNGQVKFKEKI